MKNKNTGRGLTHNLNTGKDVRSYLFPLERKGGWRADEGERTTKICLINKLRALLTCPIGHPLPLGRKGSLHGFTLMELLVVVLIIGILAAVAVPQYQLAVDKSRLLKLLPLARAVKDAQELYYMENGRYATTWAELNFDLPQGVWILKGYPGQAVRYKSSSDPNGLRMTLYGWQYFGVGPYNPDFLWIWNYDHSVAKGRLDCYTYNAYAKKLAKAICVYDEKAKHYVYRGGK